MGREVAPSAIESRLFSAVSGSFCLIPAGKERAFKDEHEGTVFLILPTSEMLRFLSSDSEISAPQSPRLRHPTVDVHRSFSTESRSF